MKRIMLKSLLGLAFCLTLSAFTPKGGDSYTIHLNDKKIVQYYVHSKEAIPSFSLDQSSLNSKLLVYYSECGKIGKERKLTLRDDKGALLAKWEYKDVSEEHTPMDFKVKEITALKKVSNKVSLFYTSREVSKERILANITLGDELKASTK